MTRPSTTPARARETRDTTTAAVGAAGGMTTTTATVTATTPTAAAATTTRPSGKKMKILIAHNFYQQPGGEDQVFRSELELLESFGHQVQRFEMHNDDVGNMGRLRLLGATVWNRSAAARLSAAVREHRAEIVHFHNTFPLMSPAVYYAARREGAAVVQTLHNFRLLCPGANFYRGGKVCEDCLGKSLPLAGVKHKCYRDSAAATAATVTMLSLHRLIGTWATAIDAYITP